MDQERARLQADLLGLVDCEVHCSEPFLQIYASDASIYQILPLGIVRPRNTADVVAVVQYAAEHQIPIGVPARVWLANPSARASSWTFPTRCAA